jgi:tRNA-uridine 2-sulfurtransferase
MKVLAAMSGGVDSSTAAALLKQEGHEVLGVTLKLYGGTGKAGLKSCCGYGPEQDAKRVAEALGIRHLVLNAEKLFQETVIDDFLQEYAAGRTPNPCVRCNTFLKFDYLLKQARMLGMEAVATGHYAQVRDGRLYKALDPAKDQSYFLYTLHPGNLPHVLFPAGGFRKNEIRKLAKALGLPVHDKEESQDICFLPRGKYREFLENRGVQSAKGFMFNLQGRIVGEHRGLYRYTVGQRKGLGPQGKRCYVIEINSKSNTIILGEKKDLTAFGVELSDVTYCAESFSVGQAFEVRLRYRGPLTRAVIARQEGTRIRLRFDAPVESIAPGQSAVLYRGDEVAGGGLIVRKLSDSEAP